MVMINLIKSDTSLLAEANNLQAYAYKIQPSEENPNWILGFHVVLVGDDDNTKDRDVFEVQIDCGKCNPQIEGQDFT